MGLLSDCIRYIERIVMPLKTSDEKQDLILKVFDYFEAESKLSLGESEMNIYNWYSPFDQPKTGLKN
jgi:hypothetical protein